MWKAVLLLLSVGSGFLLLSAPQARANPDCLPPPSSIVAWWPGEGTGDDIVGNRDATAINGAAFTTGNGGKVGEAFSLDGSNDYFEIPHNSVFNLSSAVTIEAWVLAPDFADDPDNFSPIIAKGDTAWRMQRHSNSDFAAFGTSGLSNVDQVGNDVIDGGAWHHVAATFDASTDTKTLYVDGVVDAQDTATTGSISANGEPVRIGNNSQVTTRFWGGLIDEVTLYNRALSAAEVAALHAAGSDGKCKTATTLTPTRFDDPTPDSCLPADCSLREAVIAANGIPGTDTIEIPSGTYTLSRAGTNEEAGSTGDLDITTDVTITGAGASATVVDADDIDRVFDVISNGTSVDISGITITDGNASGSNGGGILNNGDLTLDNVTVSANTAGLGGGLVGLAGSSLTVTDSTFTGNSAGFGGGVYVFGGNNLTMTNSTVSGNSATSAGGGLLNDDTSAIINSTFTGNSASTGGGIYNDGTTVTLDNTIVANSTSGGNCGGTITDGGGNLQGPTGTTCGATITTADPLLGGLAYNGGETQTHALDAASPAIDTGTNTGCPSTDQRGASRPADGPDGDTTATCDIGAYEFSGDGAVLTVTSAADTTDGTCSPSHCTLREALMIANGQAGKDTIEFDIPQSDARCFTDANEPSEPDVCSLRVGEAFGGILPFIVDPVTINGYTQEGASDTSSPAEIQVELTGELFSAAEDGLTIMAGNSTIKGLAINRWPGDGIEILTNGGNTIEGNYVGTDAETGNTAEGNDGFGILVGSTGNTIGGSTPPSRNVISANGGSGVVVNSAATDTTIEGNTIGLGADGSTDLGNGAAGVYLLGGASSTTIGGTTAGERNVISGNDTALGGVRIEGETTTNNTVIGNYIGTNAAGDTAVANFVGIDIRNTSGNSIGNGLSGGGNLISGNLHHGIDMIDDVDPGAVTNNLVLGNLIGTTADGTTALGNGSTTNANGISMNGISSNTVGGDSADERNVISGNGAGGIRLNNQAQSNTIQGNYIGTTADGQSPLGNGGSGVNLTGNALSNNTIGGTASGVGNVISANTANGILLNSGGGDDDLIQGNKIGVAADGTTVLGNGQHGVSILNGTDATVGGTTSGAANTIANNAGDGVRIDTGTSHGVSGNSIFSNGDLGIDLLNDGVTGNDSDDPDTGPNNLQNFPTITNVSTSASTTVEGTLDSTASTTFDLDFYYGSECDPSGNGEGETYLGTIANQITDANGDLTFSNSGSPFSTTIPDGSFVTATATGPDGTSEFSACFFGGPHVVNSTDDDPDDDGSDLICDTSGTVGTEPECTLRAAIQQANDNSGAEEIEFDIPATDTRCLPDGAEPDICTTFVGQATNLALPEITDPVVINGYTQEGAAPASSPAEIQIVLNGIPTMGGTPPPGSDGLRISAGDSTVKGLAITTFTGDGIEILTNGGNFIEGNHIGVGADGLTDIGNVESGVEIGSPVSAPADANTIGGTSAAARNVISGNEGDGVNITTNNAHTIQGNYIGLGADGSTDVGNTGAGVNVTAANGSATIGGTTPGARNVISGNGSSGVVLNDTGGNGGHTVQGNYIGTDAAGTLDRGNALSGISIPDTGSNIIGGTAAGAGNVISGNDASGITNSGGNAGSNVIQGNYIGVDANGTNPLGNTSYGILVDGDNHGNQVGGSSAGARNVISGNGLGGISIELPQPVSGTSIEGNYIGTNAAGSGPIANGGDGVAMDDLETGNTVVDNLISGNTGDGIEVSGTFQPSGNAIQGNKVGVAANGTTPMGNTGQGVNLADTNAVQVGGTGVGDGNTIANNGGDGVLITNSGDGNTVIGNSIFANGQMGIDLDPDGVTSNDAADPDTGPNNLQNFPVLTSAVEGSGVSGSLNSTPSTSFTIGFYSSPACDGSGNGEGATFLGSLTTPPTNGSGDTSFTFTPAPNAGSVVTATATSDSTGDTSEFSACRTVESPPNPGGGAPADTDGDGIPQNDDDCPFDAEDQDGFEDQDGCPESDNDEDDVPDAQDDCPNQAEDPDGFEDSDGCPEPGPQGPPTTTLPECQANPALNCGTDGDDQVTVGNGQTWYLGGGNDVVTVTGCDNVIYLQGGNDVVLILNDCANIIFLGDGDDSASVGGAVARSEAGSNSTALGATINGEAGNDSIRGGSNNNSLRGGLGNDFLAGLAGDDILKGGGGADKLRGGKGDDTLKGGAATDSCKGGAGQNKLKSCE